MNDPHIRNLPTPYISQRENTYLWKEREAAYIGFDEETLLPQPNPNAGNIGKIIEDGLRIPLAGSSCNITCICMVLRYLGVTNETPTQMLEKVFDVKNPKTIEFLNKMIDSGFPLDMGNPSHDIIETNRFSPAFVNTFYGDKGVVCDTKWELTSTNHTIMEQQIAKGIPCIMYVGTTRPVVNIANNDDLKIFLQDNTNAASDTRINLGSNITYYTMCETLEYFDIIDNQESTELELQEAQTKLDSVRNTINSLKIATKGSHFIVVRGFTDDSVIINDPWGEPKRNNNGSIALTASGYWNYYESSIFGDSIIIKKSDFKKRYRDDGAYFAWTFHSNSLWDFVYPNFLPKLSKPQLTDYTSCYDTEEYNFGAFPIRKSLTWHNGIHVKGNDSKIHSIGPGSIVAARIRDKPSGDSSTFSGSRCFVLIKHHILIDENLKEFYSLYYHLKPTLNFTMDQVRDYKNIDQNDYYEWLKQIAVRPFNRAVCPWNKEVTAYPYNRVSDIDRIPHDRINGTKKLAIAASTVYETIETVKIYNKEKDIPEDTKIIVFRMENGNEKYFAKVGDFTKVFTNTNEYKQLYQNKITSLENGEITYFDDLPSNDGLLEVGSREIIGHTGWFNGYLNLMDPDIIGSSQKHVPLSKVNRIFQLEIFSDQNIIPDLSANNFVEIDMTNDTNSNILNGEKILNALTNEYDILNANFFEELADFGIITTKEFLDFYKTEFGKERLRSCIIKGYNEGSDKINWSDAYNNGKGFLKNSFGVLGTTLDTVTNIISNDSLFLNQNEYIEAFRKPHIWFDNNMIKAMNSSTNTLFRQGKTTSYHPIRFLKWLIENNWEE